MTEKKKVLGRGISSLIRKTPTAANQVKPEASSAPRATFASAAPKEIEKLSGVLEVPISSIRINPRQPRKYFETKGIEELCKSIKVSGVLQPLVVRQLKEGYELIAGERRLRASKLAGLKRVPIFFTQIV